MSQSPLTATAVAVSLAAAMTLTALSTSQAAPYSLNPVPVDPIVEAIGSKLTGKQRLNRLFRQHYRAGNPITQSVRDATGDPNITVQDYRRSDFSEMYSCSYFFLRKNQRVLRCD